MDSTKIRYEDKYHTIEIEEKKGDIDINEFFELCITLAKACGYHQDTIDGWLNNDNETR